MGIRKILETTETNKINDRRFYIPTRVRNKPRLFYESSWSEQNWNVITYLKKNELGIDQN